MTKKVRFTERQIKMLAEVEAQKLKNPVNEGIEDMLSKHLGDDEDKKIEYPSQEDLEGGIDSDTEMDGDDTIKVTDMKGASELLGYLDKLEEAKSVLSKIAAKEDDDNIKGRIYAHYEKTQKLIFELIKEFGIVH
jgi:hypothetical protein